MASPDRPHGLAVTITEGCRLAIGDITVWVTKARGGQARLVVDAPTEARISRPETTPQ